MSDKSELQERVAQACRVLGRLDLAEAATGHISVRVPGTDRVLIRARGPGELGVRYTTVDQVVEVDLDGKLIHSSDEALEVPIEVHIHTAVYRKRPEVHSVVHVHPPTVVLFTICDKPLLPLYGAFDPSGAQMALAGIPTYPRSILISNPKLGDDLAAAMGSSRVCLMRGHGITTAGPTIEEAALDAINLNTLATMNYRAQMLGNPQPIPAEDQEVFRTMAKRSEKRSDDGQPSGRAAALWRYYCALTAD
jgi:ribulose-5-phosphate 4-epimerase/fuculose-1-phosphate aldolase